MKKYEFIMGTNLKVGRKKTIVREITSKIPLKIHVSAVECSHEVVRSISVS